MIENLSDSPKSIIERLEKLRMWQEEQQKILIDKQNAQRQMLGMEQKKMYEILGLSANSSEGAASITVEHVNSLTKIETPVLNNSDSSEDSALNHPNHQSHTNPENDVRQTEEMNYEAKSVRKRPFLRRGQGLISRFKVDPEAFRLHNLPKYKYANAHKQFKTVRQAKVKPPEKCENIKKRDEFHKQVPVKSPEISRPGILHLKNTKTLRKSVEFSDSSIKDISEEISYRSPKPQNDTKTSTETDDSQPISWAEVLNPHNIQPHAIVRNNNSTVDSEGRLPDDLDNLSIFELLERKANEGSFSFNSSSIRKWIENKMTGACGDDIEGGMCISAPEKIKTARISPLPFDLDRKLSIDESDENDSESENENPRRGKYHVRFSEEVEINEVELDEISIISDEMETVNASKTSTPNDKQDFDRFKTELFGGNGDDTTTTNTTTDESTLMEDKEIIEQKKHEIIEKTDLLKSRLAELEAEISTFKKHNAELTRLKQEHELEKIQLQQERIDMEEKLNDEKIKMEIYLHDERMKIEDEKKKLEKLLKEQKIPNRREREEITKLKEQIDNLQKENKNKEGKHVAAQARLRAQIRNLEKEVKDLYFEIDHLKKENKKLESENAKLNRQNNCKMLQEINKTIAKLAPKEATVTEVKNKSTKPVVAKVFSHTQVESRRKSKSKSLTDLREDSSSTSEPESNLTESSDEDPTSERYPKVFENRKKERRKSKITLQEQSAKPTTRNDSANNSNDSFKREIINSDGSKDIWYTNGNLKKISADGMIIRMLYYNKDIKETNITEGTIKYYYAETNTWHTTYLDGLEILEFPNGQTEHRYKDGTIEVHFPNGSIRISNPTDDVKVEEWRYPDGTTLVQMKNGDKILSLPNGQKEIHTKAHKRREYPDGTVKIVYPDGSQETRYSNGRVRLKDKDGNLVMDSENSQKY